MPKIADTSIPKHHAEIAFLRAFIVDVKKQLLGLQINEPITVERVDGARKMLSRLEECRQEVKIKH